MSKTQHPITDELLDQLLANYQNSECGFHGHPATHSMSIWPPIPR